jgi:DNA-binding GntR family transcriptional regulator
MLRLEGLIASRQGVGTIVVRNTINDAYTDTYTSIEELTHYAEGHPIRVDRIEDVIADAALAERVGCQVGQSFLAVTGRRYDRTGLIAEPVCHVVALVDARFRGIRRHLATLNSAIVSAIEAEFGHSVARITQEIKPAAISAELAPALNVEPGLPALSITRWYHGTDERVFEIAQSHYPIGRFTYRTELIRKMPR